MSDSTLEHMEGDNRPPAYYEYYDDGTCNLVLRASAIGTSCIWDLIAAAQGYTPNPLPPNLKRAFQEGHDLEPVVLAKIEQEHGVTIHSRQAEGSLELIRRTETSPGLVIRYHPDGVGEYYRAEIDTVVKCVVEVKALSHDLWKRFVRHGMQNVIEEYGWQGSVMMFGERLPLLWVGYNKGYAPDENGVKKDCEDQGKIHVQFVAEPIIPYADIVVKAIQIKEEVEGEDILESQRPCYDSRHFPCRYLHLRPDNQASSVGDGVEGGDTAVVELDDSAKDRLDELARAYIYHKGQADENEGRRKAILAEILDILPNKGTHQTDRFIIPVMEGTGQKTIAWDEMTDEDKERLQQYLRDGKKYKYLRGVKGIE